MASYSGKQPVRSYAATVRDKSSRNAEREDDPLLSRYNPTWGASSPECCKCEFYSFLKTATVAGTILAIFTLWLLPTVITAWRVDLHPHNPIPNNPYPTHFPEEPPKRETPSPNPPKQPWHPPIPPPPPPPPFRKAGLNGYDVPSPGSVYIITEGNSTNALTYDGDEGVSMEEYTSGHKAQRWGCHEADGWLGFTMETGGSTVFLGYSAWPSPPTLRCSARSLRFNEMFVVSKLPKDGFRMVMRDSGALKPVGRNSGGRLAMVGSSDVWWRFSKV